MKIFFLSSHIGTVNLKKELLMIYNLIEKLGHQNISKLIFTNMYLSNPKELNTDVNNKIKSSDICIFETTKQSLGLGNAITLATQQHKPVIILYSGKKAPMFLLGSENENLQIIKYKPHELERILTDAITYAENLQDVRFNLMLPAHLSTFLSQEAKLKNISKAHLIRKLLLKHQEEIE